MRVVVLAVVACVSFALAATPVSPQQLAAWPVYDRYCLACHGEAGNGKGPAAAYADGDPRDFTRGAYEWRSTAVGEPPTDDDLRAGIRFGALGTSMHGFDQILSDTEITQLVALVKSFSPAAFAKPGKVVVLGAPPAATNAARGAELWTSQGCTKCHGATGRGDGGGGIEPPYDLTSLPIRRPRSGDPRHAVALSIATGLTGTGMPGYAGALPDADIWALADHVLALAPHAPRREPSVIDAGKISADRATPLEQGLIVAAQGTPPAALAPAQASLSEQQCARCHAKQAREWTGSVHAAASSWGLGARELDHAVEEGTSCNRCHTPLAEQQPGTALFDASLRAQGVQCAGCHVRSWTRHGPPRRAPSLLPASSYPLVEDAAYERSDFCMPCHQLPPRTAVNGKPLLNTYKEWLEGPYMARGVQCQHCHMPNREHTWLGVHDKATVRQGIRVSASAHRANGAVTVEATLDNIGAGHYLPTTATPALWLRVELIDASGTPIAGARAERRIGREIAYRNGWTESADTRIPPGESITLARAWTAGRTAQATAARVTVEVHPDAYYEGLYAQRLATKLPAATRTAYDAALARARATHYIAEQLDVAIDSALPSGALRAPAKPGLAAH